MGILKLDQTDFKDIQDKIEEHSAVLNNVVNDVINPYCKDLDNYVKFIRDCLKDGENPPTSEELDDFCLNLSTLIYFTGSMCEQLGIKDDISKALWKEQYNTYRDSISGTVADKNSYGELMTQQEQLVNACYNRAYKVLKSKIDNAQELLGSCKKVLSRRMAEFELTHIQR